MTTTYKIVRMYKEARINSRTIRRGLTLSEAQAHCKDPETSSSTATSRDAKRRTARLGEWFDGYEQEGADISEILSNLDCQSPENLRRLWREWHRPSHAQVMAVLRGTRATGRREARSAIETLATYAINKSCAMALRAGGEIPGAMTYEAACDIHYEDLPEWAKW